MGNWRKITQKQLTERHAQYIWDDIICRAIEQFLLLSLAVAIAHIRTYSSFGNVFLDAAETLAFMEFVGIALLYFLRKRALCILRYFHNIIGISYFEYVSETVPGVPAARVWSLEPKVTYRWVKFNIFMSTLWFRVVLIKLVCNKEREEKKS